MRRENDAYYTPPALARALVRVLERDLPLRPLSVLEPSSGGGAFVQAAANMWDPPILHAVDLAAPDPGSRTAFFNMDFLEFTVLGRGRYELVLGNPPFAAGAAEAHARHAMSLVQTGGHVAFLLRLAFLSSQGRAGFWEEFPARRVHILQARPSFTDDGKTDRYDYAFFVWRKGDTEMGDIRFLRDWKNG